MSRKSRGDAPPLRDHAERRRIVTELGRSLLVEAGAGSGKTHEMAARMAAGIASGDYEIEHMAAVTFTRKAAAELRGRFQIALEDALQDSGPLTDSGGAGVSRPDTQPDLFAAEAADRIRYALANIERFFAGTIHAFCARLLRERPVEAGVAPGFTELDDAEDALVREQSWRDYRTQAQAEGDADFLLLDDSGIKPQQLDEAFRRICLYEEVEFPAGDVKAPDDRAAWKALEAFWTEFSRHLPDRIDPGTTCRFQQKAEQFKRDWDFFSRVERTPAVLATLLADWEFTQKTIVQSRWSDDKDEKKRLNQYIPELHQAFRAETVDPFLAAWRRHLYGVCVRVLTRARAGAAEGRRRRNALSFNDLLIRTAELLRTRPDVRRAMQRKYRWLFVDEFQDTDPIQAEIIFLLAGDEPDAGPRADAEPARGGADWRTIPVRPGALFVVGDPKQSIYRFTRADIDIYNQVRERLAGADGRGIVSLTTNFRSVPLLCDWANTVFETKFPKEADECSPRFAPLDAKRDAEPDGRQGIWTLTLPADAEDGVGEEAERIARYIRAEVDAGRRKAGDFLVLTRKKKNLHRYADALEARQIPVEVSGSSGFRESAEVRQLALLLLALTDPQDQVALVGVLRGALFGLSDRELFAWRQTGGWFSIFAEVPAAGAESREGPASAGPTSSGQEPAARHREGPASAGPTGVADALACLRRWHKWTRMLPAGAALERILEDSGYLALAAATPGGVDAGDLLHAVDRVRAVVETGFTLAEAAEALASWSALDEDGPDESTEVESLPLEPGRPDVVRVMNLHKAKGLEAPVVFLADPTGGYPRQVDVRILRGADSTPLGYFQISAGYGWQKKPIAEPEDWERLHDEELRYLQAEDTRLLYVAATRAKDALVVGRWAKSRGTPAWQELDPHLSSFDELVVPDDVARREPPAMDLGKRAAERALRAAENAHGGAIKPSWSASSVTAEAKRLPATTLAAGEGAQADDPTRSITEDTPSRRADAGIAWGTLIHGILEHAMRFGGATRDDLRRLAMWLTMEEPQLRPVIEQALDTVEAVAEAGFWKEAKGAPEEYEEVPFAVRRTDGGLPQVVSGAIDLVYRHGDGWRIVDYKTDVDARPETDVVYRAQIAAYRDAWQRVAPGRVTASVVSTRTPPGGEGSR